MVVFRELGSIIRSRIRGLSGSGIFKITVSHRIVHMTTSDQ